VRARPRNGYVGDAGSAASRSPTMDRSTPPPAPPHRPLSFVRQVQFWGFAVLVVLAVVFYLSWGLAYGGWFDNGVYAVTIVLLLFGLAGMWLALPNPPAVTPPPPG
jgi:hypothetical protein